MSPFALLLAVQVAHATAPAPLAISLSRVAASVSASAIALINFYNRINVPVRQTAGSWASRRA